MKKAINWLNKKEEFAILYDSDGDGICSCALMVLLLEEMGKKVVKTVASPRPSLEKNPAMELVQKYENIIVLDISMSEKNVKALENKNVLNIDHHETGLKKNTSNIIVIKKVKPYTPTALLVYELGKKILENFEKYDWIATTGIISDYGGPQHEKLVKETHKKYGLFTGETPYFDSQIGRIANIINGIRMAGETNKLNVAVKALITCSGPKEFLKGETPRVKYLHRLYNKVNEFLELELERFEKKSTKKDNRVLFLLKNPKYNIRSTLVTILSTKYSETLAVAEIRKSDYVHISLRAKKENLLEIIDELKTKIECDGGGHKKASGLTLKKEDFPIFKKEFLKK
ncbi:MAG: DHH family phosphoesterase [Nanoarchaeota archaeon]|nr:DHH family phosphoesterase [Nanoarchaeota archaeon]